MEIQEAAGIYWPEAFQDPEKMANLAIASQEITGFGNVNIGYEFSILPEVLGCEIQFYDRHALKPSMLHHAFDKPEDVKMPDDFLKRGRIPAVMEAIRLVRKKVGDFLPVTSFVFGPYSLAGELVEPTRFLMWAVKNPESAEKVTNFAAEAIIEYGKAQYRAGSDVISLGEPLGTPDIMGLKIFREYIKPALKKIADNLGGIRILHLCGDVEPYIPDIADIGFDAISIKQSVDIARIKPVIGDVKILGNVESKVVLTHGTVEEVRAVARKALEAGVTMLEPCCGLEALMPLDNIKVLVEEARNFKLKE